MKSFLYICAGALTAFLIPTSSIFAAFVSDIPVVFETTSPDNFIEVLATDGETLYVGGSFTEIDGVARQGFAAFDIETQTLLPLDLELDGDVTAILVDGGTVYVGGNFTDVNNGTGRSRLASFSTTTGIATAFDPHLDGSVHNLFLNDGILYAGGDFTCVGEFVETCDEATPRRGVAAFDTNTGLVTSFDPDVDGTVYAFAFDAGEDVLYVGGSFTTVNAGAENRSNIAGFEIATASTTLFDPGTLDDIVTDLVFANGNLYASGNFTTVGAGTARSNLALFNAAEGILDLGHVLAFDPNIGGGTGYRMHLADDGILYLIGSFNMVNGDVTRNYMAAFDDSGVVTDFDPNFDGALNGLAVDAEGNLYVGGQFFTQVGEQAAGGLAYFEILVDEDAPTVSTFSPADNAVDVAIDTTLVITFDETVVASSTGDIVLYTADDVVVETIPADDGQVSVSDDEVTITLSADLDESTSYYVFIDAGAFEDASGNGFAGIADETTWNFATVAAEEEEGSSGGSGTSYRKTSYVQREGIEALMEQLIVLLQQLLEQLIVERGN